MVELNLSFAVIRGTMCLRITKKGTTVRSYKSIELPHQDLTRWDQRKQKFTGRSEISSDNNQALQQILSEYTAINTTYEPSTARELIELKGDKIRRRKAPKKLTHSRKGYDHDTPVPAPTRNTPYYIYIQWLIYNMRHESNKKPSKNYQTYITLYHRLLEEGTIKNKPVSEICNRDFIAFGDWLRLDKSGSSNYREMMKRFHSAHGKAFEHELNDNVLRYKFMNDAPRTKKSRVYALTKAQYDKLVHINLDEVKHCGPRPDFHKQIYLDFCIFMYEMKIRPVDAVKLHSRDIITERGEKYIRYTPEKKKNYHNDCCVTNKITETAAAIIRKYSGMSAMGYVFPLSVNEYKWDYEDPSSWNVWNTKKQHIIQQINRFLKKVAPLIGADSERISVYAIRHSAFTHEIAKNEKPLMQIAKEGGTGIDMLESHYYHYIVS